MYHRRTVVNPFGHVMSCHVMLSYVVSSCGCCGWVESISRNRQEKKGQEERGILFGELAEDIKRKLGTRTIILLVSYDF